MDIIRPNYRSLPVSSSGAKVTPSSQTQTTQDDKSDISYVVTKDRRRNNDRRSKRGESRDIYDMRSGRGRRKEDGASTIHTKV